MEHLLPYLLILACPVSMGAMMWLMMRDKREPNDEVDQLKRRVQELEKGMTTTDDAAQSAEPVATHGSPKPDSP